MKTFTTKIGSSAKLVYPHKLMARRRLTIMVSSFIWKDLLYLKHESTIDVSDLLREYSHTN